MLVTGNRIPSCILFKLAVTRGAVFSSRCTQYRLSAGLCLDPLGAYSAPPDPVVGFKGPTSKEGEGKGGKWRGGKGRHSGLPLHIISGYATVEK